MWSALTNVLNAERYVLRQVATAVKRGILFEITYSPVIQGSATRRQVMESTSLVVEYMRGKHFILSSDVDSHAHLRGPYDVMNIGCVVGLPEEQVKITRDLTQDEELILLFYRLGGLCVRTVGWSSSTLTQGNFGIRQ